MQRVRQFSLRLFTVSVCIARPVRFLALSLSLPCSPSRNPVRLDCEETRLRATVRNWLQRRASRATLVAVTRAGGCVTGRAARSPWRFAVRIRWAALVNAAAVCADRNDRSAVVSLRSQWDVKDPATSFFQKSKAIASAGVRAQICLNRIMTPHATQLG